MKLNRRVTIITRFSGIMFSLLLLGGLAACSDDTENFDNRVYISTSVKASTVLLKTETAEGQFQLALAKPEEKDIIVKKT
jgi:hypothetical protein